MSMVRKVWDLKSTDPEFDKLLFESLHREIIEGMLPGYSSRIKEKKLKILQLCAAGISAPAITKELERLGHEVIKADSKPPTEDYVVVPSGKNPLTLMLRIEEIAAEYCCLTEPLIILPHNQDETQVLSETGGEGKDWKAWFAMVPSPISFYNTINKIRMTNALKRGGLPAQQVEECPRAELFACDKDHFYKPVEGCGGNFAFSSEDIPSLFVKAGNLSGQEYSFDVLCKNGVVLDWCVRKRIKAHGGICIDAEVLGKDERFKESLQKFAYIFALNGPYAIQCFRELTHRQEIKEEIYFTDCNARFGGGVGLSIVAGWKGVENWCRALQGETIVDDYEIKQIRVRRGYMEKMI